LKIFDRFRAPKILPNRKLNDEEMGELLKKIRSGRGHFIIPVHRDALEVSRKQKVNWIRVFTVVNFVATMYLYWVVYGLHKVMFDLADAQVFMAKIFAWVYLHGKGLYI